MRLYINIMTMPDSDKCINIFRQLFEDIRDVVSNFNNNCFIISNQEVTDVIKDTLESKILNMFNEIYTIDPRHDDDIKYIIDKLDNDLEVAHNNFHSYLADAEIKYEFTDKAGNTTATSDTLSNLLPPEVWIEISNMIDRDVLKVTTIVRRSIDNLRDKAGTLAKRK